MLNFSPKRYKLVFNEGSLNILDLKAKKLLYNPNLYEAAFKKVDNFKENSTLILYNPPRNYKEEQLQFLHVSLMKKIDDIYSEYPSFRKEKYRVAAGFTPFLVFHGLGTGIELEEIVKYFYVDKVLIIEPEIEFFYLSLFLTDWELILNKLSEDSLILYIGLPDNKDKFIHDVELLLQKLLSSNPIGSTYLFVFKNRPLPFEKEIVNAVHSSQLASLQGWGFIEDEELAILHSTENLSGGFPVISHSEEFEQAFIVGAGPSLDKDIDYIHKYQDHAIIFACGTAIHPLLKNGIIPDFLVELERTPHIYDVISTIPEELLEKIPLISPDVLYPKVVKLFKEVFFFIREPALPYNLLRPKFKVSLCFPTVTNAALAIALAIGFKKIFLFGVDFGTKYEDKFHASSTVYRNKNSAFFGKDDSLLESASLVVNGNFGGTVRTTDVFNWARSTMEIAITYYSSSRRFKVYNCSDGAKIKGAIPLRSRKLRKFLTRIDKTKEIEKFKSCFSRDYLSIFSAVPPSDFKAAIKNFRTTFLKLLGKENPVSSKIELYKKVEEFEYFLKKLPPYIKIAVEGSLRHPIHEIYINSLRLEDEKEVQEAYKRVKPVLMEYVNSLSEKLFYFAERYELFWNSSLNR